MLELLRASRFDELDQLFGSLEARVREDIRRERDLVDACEAFYGSDPTIRPFLDEWVRRSPMQLGYPRVARGQYWRARAEGVRWEAPAEGEDPNPTQRRDEFVRAGVEDAAAAAGGDPDNLCAYTTGLGLAHIYGWSTDVQALLDEALSRFPASHAVRYQALKTMVPRWGGSYDLMQEFIRDAEPYVAMNPNLTTLRGAVALNQARELRLSERYAEGLAKTEEARALGAGWDHHYERGRIYQSASDYVRALAQFDSAYALYPNSTLTLYFRGSTLDQIARRVYPEERRPGILREAEADAREAVAFQASDSTGIRWSAWMSEIRRRCEVSPTYCYNAEASALSDPEEGWLRGLLFILSLPFTIVLVLAEAHKLYLLPAPLAAGTSFFWNLLEWRRQRYAVPRTVHILAGLCFLTLVLINIDWVLAGGTMWTQRYVVITVATVLPYVVYLVLGGPRYLAKRK